MKRAYLVNLLSTLPIGATVVLACLMFKRGDLYLAAGIVALLVAFVATFIPMLQAHMWDLATSAHLIVFRDGEFVKGFDTDTLQLSPMELTFLVQASTDATLRSTSSFTDAEESTTFWVYSKERVPVVGRIRLTDLHNGCYIYSARSEHADLSTI